METVSVIYMIIMQVYIMHGFLPSWSQVRSRACFWKAHACRRISSADDYIYYSSSLAKKKNLFRTEFILFVYLFIPVNQFRKKAVRRPPCL